MGSGARGMDSSGRGSKVLSVHNEGIVEVSEPVFLMK